MLRGSLLRHRRFFRRGRFFGGLNFLMPGEVAAHQFFDLLHDTIGYRGG